MEDTPIQESKKSAIYVWLAVFTLVAALVGASFWMCYQTIRAEAYARYMGIKNVSAEKVSKVIRGVELSANNIFDDVSDHFDSPESVIAALEGKANLNPDTRGYFAAFELDYFPQQGTWFEPYIYQPDVTGFEYKQVGSARHNYTKSPWYIRAKKTRETFWSDPYYYYDGTDMSGHYCTYIRPIFDAKGKLVCVCGADMKFEWLAKELQWVDEVSRHNNLLNKYHMLRDFEFYSVILNNDGTSIAYPDEKTLTISDKDVIKDLEQKKAGMIDMSVNGVSCTVYYGPIEYMNWALAIIVPKKDLWKPMIPVGAVLGVIAFIGLWAVWKVSRKVLRENPQER